MVGRRRKPTKLHVIQGTAIPCRTNKLEPTPSSELPRPAVEVGLRVKFWYDVMVGRLEGIGLASASHSEQIMLLASRLAEFEACEADLAKNGRLIWIREAKIYEGKPIYDKKGKLVETIKTRVNPAIAQRNEAMRHCQSLLSEFGLSPASSPKVSKIQHEAKPEDRWEAFK